MARLGMDVDAVDSAANKLNKEAANIDSLIAKVDAVVKSLPGIWDGPDAKQFVNEWWPEHKTTLRKVRENIAGLAQSAKNNVAEQRRVSGRY